ncbi:MAG: hypothetical protein KatS3mg111_2758 [Pirellulaceae bacterium]|nr:MAG: hypothetical protein KatS3mg111_2758 [Pirellulaceae bacterium]
MMVDGRWRGFDCVAVLVTRLGVEDRQIYQPTMELPARSASE